MIFYKNYGNGIHKFPIVTLLAEGISIDIEKRHIYWTYKESKAIRVNLNGAGQVTLVYKNLDVLVVIIGDPARR